MFRKVKTEDFNESEWDCNHWGEEKLDGSINLTIMHAPREFHRKLSDVARIQQQEEEEEETTTEEEETTEDEEEESEDGDTEADLMEKKTVYNSPYIYNYDAVVFSIDASRMALDHYNKQQGTKYIFSSLVKAIFNRMPSPYRCWVIYCVKFKASTKLIPSDEDDKVIFHSKVVFGTRMGQFYFPLVLDVQKPVDPKVEFDFENNKILDDVTPDVSCPNDLPDLHRLIHASISEYYNHKNTNYSYKSLMKVSRHLVCGTHWWVYHIWFVVSTNPSSTDPYIDSKVFQAKVFDHKMDENAKVVMIVKNHGTPTD